MADRVDGTVRRVPLRGLAVVLASLILFVGLPLASKASARRPDADAAALPGNVDATWWGLPAGVVAWLAVGVVGLLIGVFAAYRARSGGAVSTEPNRASLPATTVAG